MNIPKGIRISDIEIGTGPIAEKGNWALIQYDCYLPKGDCVKSAKAYIRVGERETFPAIAYGVCGMAVGGIREVKVSPNITYYEKNLNLEIPQNASLRYTLELLEVSDEYQNEKREFVYYSYINAR